MGADGTILRANQAELDLLGYTRENYVGRNIAEFHVEASVIQDILARLVNGETLQEYSARLRCNDGSIKEVLIDSSVLFENGRFVHTRCFTRDVTELNRAEAATALLAAIVEASDDAVASKTLDGVITSWNAGAERIFGYHRDEAVGKSVELIIPPELREEEQAILARLRQGERIDHFETKRVAKDGRRIDVLLTISPVRDKTGKVVGASKVARDVTERKRRDQDHQFLAAASASLASLVDYESTLQRVARLAVPSFADWCTVDIVESTVSLRRVATAHADASKVRLADELYRKMPPDPNAKSGMWEIARSGKTELVSEVTAEMIESAIEESDILKSVRELGLKSYVGVPLTVGGKVLGVMTFMSAESGRRYDERDLQMAEDLANRAAVAIENARLFEELRRVDKRKNEFLATLAHELRNPLAPIRNALATVKVTQDFETLGKAHELIERQVDQMVHLVDDLVDISRITRDKLDMRMEHVELAEIINHAVETSKPVAERDGDVIEVDVPAGPLFLRADSMRLVQVFSNLLNNACKFTDSNGKIRVVVRREGSQVLVSVQDDGMGIPEEQLDSIFEMFGQIEAAQERSRGGLGIGLALVKRVIELHGGTVSASSKGAGQGSVFLVRLPLSDIQTSIQVESEVRGALVADLRVLVVDDNVDAATSAALLLGGMGNQVRAEHDGQAAVDAMAEFRPDVVLLDIGLPLMNGYEACRLIRRTPYGAEALMIAMTGWAKRKIRESQRRQGSTSI